MSYLNKITTQWSRLEEIMEKHGPETLADFLVARYFDSLTLQFKIKCPKVDDDQAHDLASSVMYELMKNQYRGLQRLDRNRGKLRGLLAKIVDVQIVLHQKRDRQIVHKKGPVQSNLAWDSWLNIVLDFDETLDKMKRERPLLHTAFVLFYIEGYKISEIAECLKLAENAVKQRLYSARRWLAGALKDYS